jgi:nucleolar GTP-binding protein
MVAISIKKKSQRAANLDARKGEGDRVILNMRPKHLLSGKRKSGTTDRR